MYRKSPAKPEDHGRYKHLDRVTSGRNSDSNASRRRFADYIEGLVGGIVPLHDYCTGLLPGPQRTAPKHQPLLQLSPTRRGRIRRC
jgi:hypothetical protein